MYSTHPYPIYPVTSPKTYLAALNANLLYICIHDFDACVYIHMYIYIYLYNLVYIFQFFPLPKRSYKSFQAFTFFFLGVSPGVTRSPNSQQLTLRGALVEERYQGLRGELGHDSRQPCKIPRNWEWQGGTWESFVMKQLHWCLFMTCRV